MTPVNTILCPITFASKSLTGAEQRYSNIKCEVLGILHGLEKFHHYCFSREVLIITDHTKPLVSMFRKEIATLLQHIQHILLKIHQYRVQIIYKPGPKIFIGLVIKAQSCRGQGQTHKRHGHLGGCHTECNRHARMCINGRNTSIFTGQPPSTTKKFIIAGWPDTKDKLHGDLRPYWSYRDKLAAIDCIIL